MCAHSGRLTTPPLSLGTSSAQLEPALERLRTLPLVLPSALRLGVVERGLLPVCMLGTLGEADLSEGPSLGGPFTILAGLSPALVSNPEELSEAPLISPLTLAGTAFTMAASKVAITGGTSDPELSLLLPYGSVPTVADAARLCPAWSRLQVLPSGLNPSQLEEGVIPLSIRRAAGRLQVDGFLLMPEEKGMSRNPVKLALL